MVLNKSCILLIVISGMERFAFKGVASNLVTYLTDDMKMSNSNAAKFVNIWVGFTSMMPLIVATLADTYWQRYSTIVASSLLYAAGLLALTSTAVQWPWLSTNHVHSIPSLLWSLYMISLGQGGYNPSLQAFGAEQLENGDEEELPLTNNDDKTSAKKSLFFQWWYFGVCCGSLLGVSLMSYVQDTYGWGLGFAIPAFAMIMSILLFLYGNRLYIHKPDTRVTDGKLSSFVYIVHAIKTNVSKMINRFSSDKYQYVAVEIELEKVPNGQGSDPDPNPKTEETTTLDPIEAVRIVLRMLPVWVMLLTFAVIFQQPATFFTKQGMAMKRNIGSNFKIPPAALQSAITISIITLMPFYDKLFVPFVRLITRNDKGVSVMQRIGIGMLLSIIAMVIAAITEHKRLEASKKNVDFGIFWLLPQYILLGISDIFTVVGMQEYFYSEVPANMRTIGIALYTSVFGVGSFLSAFFICLIEYLTSYFGGAQNDWFADDLNKGRLDKYYCFLTLAGIMSLLAFIIFCTFFRGKA